MTKELANKLKKEEANREKLLAKKADALAKSKEKRDSAVAKLNEKKAALIEDFNQKDKATTDEYNALISASEERLKHLNALKAQQEKLEAQFAALDEKVSDA